MEEVDLCPGTLGAAFGYYPGTSQYTCNSFVWCFTGGKLIPTKYKAVFIKAGGLLM